MIRYELESIDDVYDLVEKGVLNEDNIDNFLKDFGIVLKMKMHVKRILNTPGNRLGGFITGKTNKFFWSENPNINKPKEK